MLKPAIAKLLLENDSAYSLVIAVAKRSRDIAAEALEDKVILEDKPVNIAIDEFGEHKYRVVEGHEKEE
ncbi:MAG: DNA-directed RNA polymerase subunit omega [Oscillospiraceae bacterium]|nr:DNA-directed RNA polymerase subunit omega [Oscillospiraceae bacterium]